MIVPSAPRVTVAGKLVQDGRQAYGGQWERSVRVTQASVASARERSLERRRDAHPKQRYGPVLQQFLQDTLVAGQAFQRPCHGPLLRRIGSLHLVDLADDFGNVLPVQGGGLEGTRQHRWRRRGHIVGTEAKIEARQT